MSNSVAIPTDSEAVENVRLACLQGAITIYNRLQEREYDKATESADRIVGMAAKFEDYIRTGAQPSK